MTKHVTIIVIVLIVCFIFVIGLYAFLPSSSSTNSHPNNQSGFNHVVAKSDGRANLINQPGECSLSLVDTAYIAILEFRLDNGTHLADCSGSLINHRYVMTSALCLYNKHLVNVRLGSYRGQINAGVESIIINEHFSTIQNMQHNIGLIRLSRNIPFEDNFIGAICIPEPKMNISLGQRVEVIGYSMWSNDDVQFQKVDLNITDHWECKLAYRPIQIQSSELCARGEDGKDACRHILGGPIVLEYNNRAFVVGILGSHKGCDKKDMPGVFTGVINYHDWILEKLEP